MKTIIAGSRGLNNYLILLNAIEKNRLENNSRSKWYVSWC